MLEHSDIGAWLFKCNPKEWDIESALRDGIQIDSWRVHETYRVDVITPGDPAVLWVTGTAGASPMPGIWLVGYTTGEVLEGQRDNYWLHRQGERLSRYAGLRMTRLNEPLSRELLATDPRTSSMEVLRQPQMSNPSYLAPHEKDAVEQMLGSWPAWSG